MNSNPISITSVRVGNSRQFLWFPVPPVFYWALRNCSNSWHSYHLLVLQLRLPDTVHFFFYNFTSDLQIYSCGLPEQQNPQSILFFNDNHINPSGQEWVTHFKAAESFFFLFAFLDTLNDLSGQNTIICRVTSESLFPPSYVYTLYFCG